MQEFELAGLVSFWLFLWPHRAAVEAGVAGIVTSGTWDKWYRPQGGSWTGPDTGGYQNRYGNSCNGKWSWCSERDLGSMKLVVAPGRSDACEAQDHVPSPTCGDGTWVLTIKVRPSRQAACGF